MKLCRYFIWGSRSSIEFAIFDFMLHSDTPREQSRGWSLVLYRSYSFRLCPISYVIDRFVVDTNHTNVMSPAFLFKWVSVYHLLLTTYFSTKLSKVHYFPNWNNRLILFKDIGCVMEESCLLSYRYLQKRFYKFHRVCQHLIHMLCWKYVNRYRYWDF